MAADIRRTKIVATLGPSSATRERLRALVEAGMDAARLNLSHGTQDDHAQRAELVRGVQEELGRPIALIADLQGPKLRIGDLEGTRLLRGGDEVLVTGDGAAGNGELPIAPAVASQVLQPGHDILIDDGLVRLTVEEVQADRVRCRVVVGGEV